MAFFPNPDHWLADYVYDAEEDTITLVRESLFGTALAPEDCDGTTGDIRKLMLQFCKVLWATWLAGTEGNGAADHPTKFLMRHRRVPVDGGKFEEQFTFVFVTEAVTFDVSAEPED